MAKSILNTKTYSYAYTIFLFIIGGGIASIALLFNQQFHVSISVASLFSPTGARVTVGGVRIKHWMIGVLLMVFALAMVLKSSKSANLKELGVLILGSGAVLFGDELITNDF